MQDLGDLTVYEALAGAILDATAQLLEARQEALVRVKSGVTRKASCARSQSPYLNPEQAKRIHWDRRTLRRFRPTLRERGRSRRGRLGNGLGGLRPSLLSVTFHWPYPFPE